MRDAAGWVLLVVLSLMASAPAAYAARPFEPLLPPPPRLEDARRHAAAGDAAWAEGDAEGAFRAWGQAIEAAPGAEGIRLRAEIHGTWGGVLREIRRFDEAHAHYEDAHRGFVLAGERLRAAVMEHDRGLVFAEQNDLEHAIERYEGALDVFVELKADRHASNALNSLGIALQRQGRLHASLTCLELALTKATALEDAWGRVRALCNLGNTCNELGLHDRARRALGEALELGRNLGLGGITASLEMNLAALEFAAGRYAAALEHAERARLALLGAGDEAALGQVLMTLGAIHLELGALDTAGEHFEQALEMAEASKDRAGMAKALGNLGLLLQTRGDYEDALEVLQASLELEEELGQRGGVAETLNNIASVLLDLERLDAAERVFGLALELFESMGSRTDVARALHNLGLVKKQRGRNEEAIPFFERAIAIVAEIGAPEAEARMRWGLADALEALGRTPEAMGHLRRAVEAASRMGRGLEEQQGSRAREVWLSLFDAGVDVALRGGRPEDVFFFLESGRAGVLLEALGAPGALVAATIPEAERRAQAEANAAHRRAVLALRSAKLREDLSALRVAREDVAEARDRLRKVHARIRRHVKAGAEFLDPVHVEKAEAQSWLDASDALLLFGVTTEQAVALVVTRDTARIVRLGPSERITELCLDLVLDDPGTEYEVALEALRREVASPLGLPESVRRVVMAPHGALALVPLGLLLPGREVVCIPSATTLGRLRSARGERGGRVLALGSPDDQLPPLPGSRAEAEAVGDVCLLGSEATERGLREKLSAEERWRAVHLACHGRIDPEQPLFSSLALTPEGDDDGLLTVLEIFGLRVSADLVALSACETARGTTYRAEGILGLTHAFLSAGTPRVLCSLWEVDDAATRALMTRFYALWRPEDGLDAATALREAQTYVRSREGWAHPHYWAAWVLWGLPDG